MARKGKVKDGLPKHKFFYQRTLFRHNLEFYRKSYERYRYRSNDPKRTPDSYFFSNVVNKDFWAKLNEEERRSLTEHVKMLAYSHRYKKNESIVQNTPICWSIIRNPCYHYSQMAETEFLLVPALAFLLALFCKRYLVDERDPILDSRLLKFHTSDIIVLKETSNNLKKDCISYLRRTLRHTADKEKRHTVSLYLEYVLA